jgi:hypothetical protein
MRRITVQRLAVPLLLTALIYGYEAPAALATAPPTKAKAAAIVKGEVFSVPAATRRVARILTLVRIPARAVPELGESAPLTPTPDSIDADIYTVDDGHWWFVPGSVATVATWVARHVPVGFVQYGSGRSPSQRSLEFAPVSKAAGCCSTIEVTVGRSGKRTTLSVAVFVQWQPRRAAIEKIPVTVDTALLEVGSDPTQAMPSLPDTSVQVTGAALAPVITTLNHLAATRAEPLPCPYSPNWSKVTFRYAAHTVLFASPSACPFVEVTVNGSPSTTLSGNITDLIAQVLGVTPVPPAM